MIFNSYETPGNFYQHFIINTEVETSVVSQESHTWSWISYVEFRITRWTCHKSFTVKFTVILCWPEFKLSLQAQESSLIPVHNLRCCLRIWISFYSMNKYSWRHETSPTGMQHWCREGIVMFTGLLEEQNNSLGITAVVCCVGAGKLRALFWHFCTDVVNLLTRYCTETLIIVDLLSTACHKWISVSNNHLWIHVYILHAL